MDDEFKPEFCQEVVAVLVASIVASIIDPVDGEFPDTLFPLAQSPADAPPDALRVAAALASLMTHFEARTDALQAHGMPDHLASQYREVRDLLMRTAEYQLQMRPSEGQTRQ